MAVAQVSAPAEFTSPLPNRFVKLEPLMPKEVEVALPAVSKDEYRFVEVELVANRFTKVLVAVLVANIELKNPWDAESWVEEALPKVWSAVQTFAFAKSKAIVPAVVIAPPRSPVPAVIDVTEPAFCVTHVPL